jgi:tetratricopeptide (TPR) repeat protein
MESPTGAGLLFVPESSLARRRRWRRRAMWLALLLLVILIAFTIRPVTKRMQTWHARRLAEQGLVLIEAREWKRAAACIEQAYRLDPHDPIVLRSEGRLLTQTGNFSPGLFVWKQVAGMGALLRPEEIRDYATAAIEEGDFATASDQVERLQPETGKNAPANWLVAARLSARLGDHDLAEERSKRVISSSESTDQERYESCILLLENTNDDAARRIAWNSLGIIAEGKSSAALRALLFMARQQLDPSPSFGRSEGLARDISGIIERLNRHPEANTFSRLRAVDLRIKMNRSEEDSLIEQAIVQFKGGDNATLSTLCFWLLAHNKAAKALALLPRERASQTAQLSAAWVQSVSALGDWEAIESELEKPSPELKLDDLTVEIYLARSAARLGKGAALQNRWNHTFELAAGDKQKLIVVARAAENEKLFDKAETAYEAAVAVGPRDRANYSSLLRFAAAHRGAGKAHGILVRMVQQWPDDPGIRNSEIHAGLLAGQVPPEKARETMERLVQEHPSNLSYRATLALALLRLHDPDAALRAFGDSVNITAAGPLLPSTLAIHALTLASNDMSTLARMEAETVPLGDLVREERSLIQPLLSKSVN